jgi:Membrane carboxypeptidase (penicillin-binding protein)
MTKNRKQKKPFLRLIIRVFYILAAIVIVGAYPAYLIGRSAFYSYFDSWGNKLISLEKRGLLSKKFGAAWQDILKEEAMLHEANKITQSDTVSGKSQSALIVEGVPVNDYPSLSIVARLNTIQNYTNQILITDRRDSAIASIRTNHTRVKISELPQTFIKSLVAAEDQNFWSNTRGIAYNSIVRAVGGGIIHGITHFSSSKPRGTSTITQQVAKLFISQVDDAGRRRVSNTVDRKLREMRLAVALRKLYAPEQILEVYVNHCLTSDNGLIGCKDIARSLFNRDLKECSDAQCVYLARMVKWGRNTNSKIVLQCESDMARMGKANGWNKTKQQAVLEDIKKLTFFKPKRIQTENGLLVDCANEFWLAVLKKNGASGPELEDMDIINPNSLIRTKGNCTIKLSIDLPLQRELERLVNRRGYAPDSVANVNGKQVPVIRQYFAYAIMDSKTGNLLAYYSKDKIGSRLVGLLRNRTPNGSSTAKPIFNALNFDLGIFPPYAKWNDSVEVKTDVPWRRSFHIEKGKTTGVIFANSAVKGKGYEVHNHESKFEGCQYVFDQLAASNNILSVETVYRLNQKLFNDDGSIFKDAYPLAQYFYRLGALDRIKNDCKYTSVTGVRVYKEMARIVGAAVDSVEAGNGRYSPISDSMYSAALGTLELTLFEQMHLFNVLHNNDLIENPADHPSLIIENILLNGDTVQINDTIKRYHPFANCASLRPTYLGMHKRLAGPIDGLGMYDIAAAGDSASMATEETRDENLMPASGASNYAKSGTTDDVVQSFEMGPRGNKKTNYGMWNATIRIDFAKLSGGQTPDIRDITISCIGECIERYTGPRDGKTLHKFVSTNLLKKAGIPCANGFYSQYESYIKRETPDNIKNCQDNISDGSKEKGVAGFFSSLFSIFKKKDK